VIGPEIDGVALLSSSLQNLYLRAQNGLGYIQLPLGLESALAVACDSESQTLADPPAGIHLPSYRSLVLRWSDIFNSIKTAPCIPVEG
jgi:hypothetical protein